jgi:hypothetical protein
MKDAIGNDIIIGKHYGYSQRVGVVIGKVEKVNGHNATLVDIHERSTSGILQYVPSKVPTTFVKTKKKRTLATHSLFPVETLAESRDRKIDEILN